MAALPADERDLGIIEDVAIDEPAASSPHLVRATGKALRLRRGEYRRGLVLFALLGIPTIIKATVTLAMSAREGRPVLAPGYLV